MKLVLAAISVQQQSKEVKDFDLTRDVLPVERTLGVILVVYPAGYIQVQDKQSPQIERDVVSCEIDL